MFLSRLPENTASRRALPELKLAIAARRSHPRRWAWMLVPEEMLQPPPGMKTAHFQAAVSVRWPAVKFFRQRECPAANLELAASVRPRDCPGPAPSLLQETPRSPSDPFQSTARAGCMPVAMEHWGQIRPLTSLSPEAVPQTWLQEYFPTRSRRMTVPPHCPDRAASPGRTHSRACPASPHPAWGMLQTGT